MPDPRDPPKTGLIGRPITVALDTLAKGAAGKVASSRYTTAGARADPGWIMLSKTVKVDGDRLHLRLRLQASHFLACTVRQELEQRLWTRRKISSSTRTVPRSRSIAKRIVSRETRLEIWEEHLHPREVNHAHFETK